MAGTSVAALRPVFERFKQDPGSRLTVRMRRERARQLRELLADPEAVDLDTFNREVWVHDSGTFLHEDGRKKKVAETDRGELAAGFDTGNVEFHGNNIWGNATRVYGSQLKVSNDEKLGNLRRALRIVNDSFTPLEKARRIDAIKGFGENISTGLVMVFHPDSFAIYNRRSRGAVEKLGHDARSLEAFEQTVRQLREGLGAEDFLELDWFLYQINEGQIKVPEENLGEERGEEITTDRGPLNVILYGPPGTGKTYNVQRRALRIVEPALEEDLSAGEAARKFREYREQGRIEFVTFHQSYSYEEFVEGFRYDPAKQVPTLHKGLFRDIARRADPGSEASGAEEARKVWKVSLGEREGDQAIFERCMREGEIAVGWLDGIDLTGANKEKIFDLFAQHHPDSKYDSTNRLVNEMQEGDYVAVYGSPSTIRAVGMVTGGYEYKGEEHDGYHHSRPVGWLDKEERDILEANDGVRLAQETIYRLQRLSPQKLLRLLPSAAVSEPSGEPYVLIIDEINRGNISRIFGELITLLEPDKRRGAPNELSVRLPYSKDDFAVPANLYIIGTMNTADRSIALLDVALRRRFDFEEVMPNVGVVQRGLEESSELNGEQMDLICEVFEIINARIAALLDRDHQIGHSYFLGISSIDDLHDALYRRILPLLQEYFYNDHEQLERLLGVYDAAQGTGFVERQTVEYGKGFTLDDVGERPWGFHRYEPSELELALRGTLLGG